MAAFHKKRYQHLREEMKELAGLLSNSPHNMDEINELLGGERYKLKDTFSALSSYIYKTIREAEDIS